MKNNLSKMPVYAPMTPNEPMEAIGHRIQGFATTRANLPALFSEQGTLSWRDLLDQTNRIANRLRDAGLRLGDSVAALSENSADYVALYLGVLTAGGCMVPLSGMASAETLSLMLSDCRATFLFVSQKNADLLHRFQPGLQELPDDRIVALGEDGEGIGQTPERLALAMPQRDPTQLRWRWMTPSTSSTAPAPPALRKAFFTITDFASGRWNA